MMKTCTGCHKGFSDVEWEDRHSVHPTDQTTNPERLRWLSEHEGEYHSDCCPLEGCR